MDAPIKIDVDLARPATVLIEKIAGAVGIVYEPTRIRRKAKAEAESEVVLAKTKVKVTQIEKRAAARLITEETRKQKNMESVIEKSIPYLDKTADPNQVNDDWLTHFFEQSRKTSDNEMQDLWARLLAGEANKPGSYSKRTVNLVAELEKSDAEQFGKLSNFVWSISGRLAPLIFEPDNAIYEKNGVTFAVLKHLESLGLLSFDPLAGYQITSPGMAGNFFVVYQGRGYIVKIPEGKPNNLSTGKVLLTKQGMELLAVSSSDKIPGLEDYVKGQVESNDDYKMIKI